MRALIAVFALVSLLVASPFALPATAAAAEVSVQPSPACLIAGDYPQISAAVIPAGNIARVRVFFRSVLSPDYYYVEAVPQGGVWVARLPRPRPEAGPVSVYANVTTADFAESRSADVSAPVVRNTGQCPSDHKPAPTSPGGPVSVFDVAGNPALPAGFTGVAAVAAGGAGAAGAGAFLTSTGGLVTLAAVAVGITTIVILATRSESR